MPSNTSKLDEVMCGPYNRRGLLCGECKDGYGPAYSSFNLTCVNCSSIWSGYTIYLLLQFVPSTLMFFNLVVCRYNITSSPLQNHTILKLLEYSGTSENGPSPERTPRLERTVALPPFAVSIVYTNIFELLRIGRF